MLTADPLSFLIPEKATGLYTATLVGNNGVTPIPSATLITLTLLLYAIKQDGASSYIRGSAGAPQNVLNTGNVTVDPLTGLVTWTIQVTDTTLVEAIDWERHIALFQWTWAGGAGQHEVVLAVKNIREV